MNGAQACLKALEARGIECVFGYPGGTIMPVYDALLDSPIKHILTRHEQGAVFAADGFARSTGKVGVCLATSGPGATNLVTGIANAHMDSVPLVLITGQVPRSVLGTDAFQEIDMVGMTLPVVKHSFLVTDPCQVAKTVVEAIDLALEGRPGPVLVDLPKDVQLSDALGSPMTFDQPADRPPQLDLAAIDEARALMSESKRPVIYAGGGIGLANATREFRRFVEIVGAPVVSTLKGLGALPGRHAQHLGMLGMHGWPEANHAVQDCDLLLVIGARLDDRATGRLDRFAPHASIIHLDIDPAELGKLRRPSVALCGPLTAHLVALSMPLSCAGWLKTCTERKGRWVPSVAHGSLDPNTLMQRLAELLDSDTTVTCDVGQHQMWVAQHLSFHHPRRHLTSGGLGAMGYGIPAGLGALIGRPRSRVLTVTGDGSFLMNVQELATAKRYGLPLKVLLLDNQHLGLVRQWQDIFNDQRFSEVDLSDNPDFVEVAQAFGVPGRRIEWDSEVDDGLQTLLESEGPFLLQACIDPRDKVWPIVPAGESNENMITGDQG